MQIFIALLMGLSFNLAVADSAFMTPKAAQEQVAKKTAVLVDVREDDEVKYGLAETALWMPLSKIKDGNEKWTSFLKDLPKDKLVILYCASGKRSEKVAKLLKEKGYKTANMGGFSDWEDAGLPVQKP